MRKFLGKCADRKGAAMEMAIMMIVVVLSLSILIVTTSLLQHSKQLGAVERMQQTVELEQIGENFCKNPGNDDWVDQFPNYDIAINGQNMVVYVKDTDQVLMSVQIVNGTITQWNKK